jgi:hypothetical protein
MEILANAYISYNCMHHADVEPFLVPGKTKKVIKNTWQRKVTPYLEKVEQLILGQREYLFLMCLGISGE